MAAFHLHPAFLLVPVLAAIVIGGFLAFAGLAFAASHPEGD